jgi:hypothetical protein
MATETEEAMFTATKYNEVNAGSVSDYKESGGSISASLPPLYATAISEGRRRAVVERHSDYGTGIASARASPLKCGARTYENKKTS